MKIIRRCLNAVSLSESIWFISSKLEYKLFANTVSSFNWADEVEEELAWGANHEQSTTRFAELPEDNTRSEEEVNSDLTPQVQSKDVETVPASSAAPLRNTPSPDPQHTSARNSGIMQSRWATAPDEPAVKPESEVRKDAMLLEQGGTVTPSRSRRGRGVHTGKKERTGTPGGRSGSNSLSGSPRKPNRERNKHNRVQSTNAYDDKAPEPDTLVHTPPKTSRTPVLTSATDQPATAVASDMNKRTDGPLQTPGPSPSKNEISLSRWA